MERRQLARIPSFAQSRSLEIPVRTDLARHGPQVMPEVDDGRPPPEPIAVIDAVNDESRFEHQSVRNHRIMFGVGVLRDIEILLNYSAGVGEERPLRADRCSELLDCVVVIGGDGHYLGVSDSDLGIKGSKIQMLLVLFRAVMAARERQYERVIALEFAEPARCARVIGLLIIRKNGSGYQFRGHD